MEQFIVSARKYRPQTFKDVVGQKAITNTLLNAIENNHLAQALLFTGPRGVGKTTCARILAQMINSDGTEQTDEDLWHDRIDAYESALQTFKNPANLIAMAQFQENVGNLTSRKKSF